MPKTNAERQQAWRRRQAWRVAALEAEVAELTVEASVLRTELDAALAECDRLTATQCKHPSAAVDGSRCRACGADLW